MLELTMFPAKDGDSLLLTYTSEGGARRILIDGGRSSSYPLFAPALSSQAPEPLDVVVVTHVDQDHVLGILAMFKDPGHPPLRDVWFNGYDHLVGDGLEHFGPRDGELLTASILDQGVGWNAAFGGRSVVAGLDVTPFGDGARIRILAPDRKQLQRLVPFWEKECSKHGLVPGIDPVVPELAGFESFGGAGDIDALAATKFTPDSSIANATSISFLFEHEGARLIFTGDGDDARLVASLKPLAEAEGGRVHIDALKVAHHGSAGNLSRELLEILDCPRYLISTNGSRHHHPDDIAMARILKYGGKQKEIVFNYRERATAWDVADLKERYHYTVRSPDENEDDGFITLQW